MTFPRSDAFLVLILRLSAGLCLLGWAWVHLYWEGPYGILLWNEHTYALAERWGIGWEEFVGSGANDGVVQTWLGRIGWIYLVCAGLTISVRSGARMQMALLWVGTGLLTLLSYSKYLSAQHQLPMFIEHGGQMLSPALLVLALVYGVRHRVTEVVAIIAFIATFSGHGYYAIGWLPTPGNFHAMTSLILGVEYETANLLLRIAGALDFVVCVGILIPACRKVSALYAIGWGLLTALARPVAGMSLNLNYWGADQYLHEAVLRAPHFLLPLFLFLLWRLSEGKGAVDPLSDEGGVSSNTN